MKATESKLPIANGKTEKKGAGVQLNILHIIKILQPIAVKTKCKNDRKTIKLYPSTSVMYLLHMTTPTTDRMFPTTPAVITTSFELIFEK